MNQPYLTRISGRIAPLLATLLLVLSGSAAQAQVSNYTFTAVAGTYSPLSAISTQVAAIQADDVVSAPLPIGFTFAYDGALYTRWWLRRTAFCRSAPPRPAPMPTH